MKYIIILAILLKTSIATSQEKLSWEAKDPKNAAWTTITTNAVRKNFLKLDKAQDIVLFCPNYHNIQESKKIIVWGELISAMAFYESGWRPNAELTEISLGIDSVTGLPVQSQGLLQLSYGDTRWAKWCDFNWEEDKKNPDNPTILRPKNNLECGIGILANQIDRWGRITLSGKHAYWSVLKMDSRWKKIDGISRMVKRLQYCVE